jgi:hypothetical protein
MKNSNNTIGNRSRDLPVCSAVPQPQRHRLPKSSQSGVQNKRRYQCFYARRLILSLERLTVLFLTPPMFLHVLLNISVSVFSLQETVRTTDRAWAEPAIVIVQRALLKQTCKNRLFLNVQYRTSLTQSS